MYTNLCECGICTALCVLGVYELMGAHEDVCPNVCGLLPLICGLYGNMELFIMCGCGLT